MVLVRAFLVFALSCGSGVPAEPADAPIKGDGNVGPVRSFEVVASKFKFEPAIIAVTQGESVKLTVRSADGTHGFAIKDYKVKVVIPRGGETIDVSFLAEQAGTFEFVCSEYCGTGHRGMKGRLVVQPRAQ